MDVGYDAVNVARALDLAAGRPLADLPPEAFELRRDRSKVAPSADDADTDGADATDGDGDADDGDSHDAAATTPHPTTVTSRA